MIGKVRKGYEPIKGHKVITTRASGRDSWTIVCSCGRRWHNWRWLCEDNFLDHLPLPEPIVEPMPLWYDDASYIKYQSMP